MASDNSVNIAHSVIGGVQSNSPGATQNVQLTISRNEMLPAIEAFEAALASENVTGAQLDELRADLETIKLQMKRPSLNQNILRAAGASLKFAVEKIASAVLTKAGQALWTALGV